VRCLCLVTMMVAVCFVSHGRADDIVTVPTANQYRKGQVDVAGYYVGLQNPVGAPQNLTLAALNMGMTDRIELDGYWQDIDKDKQAIVLTGYLRLLRETVRQPGLVVGCKNMNGASTTNAPLYSQLSRERSYFICAVHTVPFNRHSKAPPLVRVHLCLGTADWTLGNVKRHQGLFGGLQFILRRDFGISLLNDGADFIPALVYIPGNSGFLMKAGMLGPHWLAGVAYNRLACW
jgi:hypothetical protein